LRAAVGKELFMLHKCANPNCANPFRRLSEGKLFLLATDGDHVASDRDQFSGQSRRIEHFWLCDQCAAVFTLSFERGRGMVTVPLPVAVRRKPVSSVQFPETADDAAS
jgi:hypothetical protein